MPKICHPWPEIEGPIFQCKIWPKILQPIHGEVVESGPDWGARGVNTYVFNGNNSIDYYDFLGLAWKIERTGRDRAHAKPEKGDTVADLAKIIGFDDKDYRKWLKPVGPSRVPSSATATITGCSQFSIPNTVFIEFGKIFRLLDGWGPIPKWRTSLNALAQSYRGDGFNVVLTDPSDPATARQHLHLRWHQVILRD